MKIASGCPEDPYGFTGKEEDKAVGLHYFGARYYSSYLGRWLSPDPPVVHDGGFTNFYNYGNNSPYIYVDPDGNWFHIVVGAIIGAVTGGIKAAISSIRSGKGVWDTIKAVMYGSFKGAAIGAATACNPYFGAGMAATFSTAETLAAGGSFKEAFLAGNKTFGMSLASGKIGGALRSVGANNFLTSTAMAYGSAALNGGVNKENWDDILIDSAVDYVGSVAGERANSRHAARQAGMGGGPRIGGAVGSAGDDAGYRTRGSHFSSASHNSPSASSAPSGYTSWGLKLNDYEGVSYASRRRAAAPILTTSSGNQIRNAIGRGLIREIQRYNPRFRYSIVSRRGNFSRSSIMHLRGVLRTYMAESQGGNSYQSTIDAVINETVKSTESNITSAHSLTPTQALDAGIQFLGPGYQMRTTPENSGVFYNSGPNGTIRQFRIDNGSLAGSHNPNVPHVHFEIISPYWRINNHVPISGD